jgi:hypothetical protein
MPSAMSRSASCIAWLTRAGQHHPVAGEDERPLGGVDQLDGLFSIPIARQRIVERFGQLRDRRLPIHLAATLLRVLRDVDEHRARPAR